MENRGTKRTRNPEKTRSHILEVAFREIYHHGFQGVSIDQIIRKTAVTKGAFFHYFATKNELGYALVDEVLREMILERWLLPLAAYRNPIQGIVRRFRALTTAMGEEDLVRGCPLNNLVQEMSAVDQIFRDKTRAVLNLWIDETERYLKKAQQGGYLKQGADTRQLAVFVVTLQEGAFGMVKGTADRKLFDHLYVALRDYLQSQASPTASDDMEEAGEA